MNSWKGAILQCDDVLEKFQGRYGNYPKMVEDSFTQVDSGIQFSCYDVRKGVYPESADRYDFYVITGSKASVYDNETWIANLVSFVQQLDALGVPVFGICFGHQIMALAKGCQVKKAVQGWGVGVATVTATSSGREFGIVSSHLNMLVSHQDQVESISPEATLLAGSEFCKYFAVQWSDNLISVQGHPEWQKAYSEALMNDRRGRIPAPVIEVGLESLKKPLCNSGFLKFVFGFLARS